MSKQYELKSLILKTHDTSYGGYPVVYVATIEIDNKEFLKNKKLKNSMPFLTEFQNELYRTYNVPAHNPTVGGLDERAKNGVKTLRFCWYSRDLELAKNIGLKVFDIRGELMPSYGARFDFLATAVPNNVIQFRRRA